MQLEIGYDPRAYAAESFLVLNEDHEILHSIEWLDWLRRRVEDPKLFIYRHRLTGRYELCQWLYTPSETTLPIAQELEGFNSDPRFGWPSDLMAPEVLVARLAPMEEIVERRRRADRDRTCKLAQDKHERVDVRRRAISRLRKMGLEREARQIEEGAVPMALPSEQGKEMYKPLLDAIRRS